MREPNEGAASRSWRGRLCPLEHPLERPRVRGHRAVHAHVDQAAPGGRGVAVLVREPVLPGVALAVGAGDVLGGGHLELRASGGEGDRHLERDHARAGRAPAEQPGGGAVDAGGQVDPGHELVEAVDRGLLERHDDQVAPLGVLQQGREYLGVLDVLLGGLVGRAALDLDVDWRPRERLQHLGEGRHAEVGSPEARRRLAAPVATPRKR